MCYDRRHIVKVLYLTQGELEILQLLTSADINHWKESRDDSTDKQWQVTCDEWIEELEDLFNRLKD